MSPSTLAAAAVFAALVTAAGCSHQQKPESTGSPRPPAARAPSHAPVEAVAAAPAPADASRADRDLAVFFDFDSSLLKDEGRQVLQTVADTLRKQDRSLAIEGHCDELGTTEYNLALGEERARAAKAYLVHLGVQAEKIATVSFGFERPRYAGHDDEARAKNRRDDLIVR